MVISGTIYGSNERGVEFVEIELMKELIPLFPFCFAFLFSPLVKLQPRFFQLDIYVSTPISL